MSRNLNDASCCYRTQSNVPTLWSILQHNKYVRRILLTAWICPSYFLSAVLWEGAGLYGILIRHFRYDDPRYFLLTGLGSFLGILLARFAVILMLRLDNNSYIFELHSALQSSLSSGVATGSLWQYSLNLSKRYSFSFTCAFLFVFAMSTICYFSTTIAIRLINTKLPVRFQLVFKPLSISVIYFDFVESLTVGMADAFFIGTNSIEFKNSWLSCFMVLPFVTPTMVAMFLAGTSATTGFLLIQILFNLILTDNWIDYIFKRNITTAVANNCISETEFDGDCFINVGDDAGSVYTNTNTSSTTYNDFITVVTHFLRDLWREVIQRVSGGGGGGISFVGNMDSESSSNSYFRSRTVSRNSASTTNSDHLVELFNNTSHVGDDDNTYDSIDTASDEKMNLLNKRLV